MKINPVYFENNWGSFTKYAIAIVLVFGLIVLYKYSQLTESDWKAWEHEQEVLRDSLDVKKQ